MNKVQVFSGVACAESAYWQREPLLRSLAFSPGPRIIPKTMCQMRFCEALRAEAPLVLPDLVPVHEAAKWRT